MTRGAMILGLLVLLTAGAAAGGPLLKAERVLDAWEVAAQSEMSTMAGQEEVCGAQTTYFVALEALNDGGTEFPPRPYDFINNGGGSFALRPSEGRFRPSRILFPLTGTLAWGGPYVTYQQDDIQIGPDPYDEGAPLDPWGNPYYFFSPLGLLRGDTGMLTLELYGDLFDRYTIVSLGWDGVMSQDDLAWQFGIGVTGAALTSLRMGGTSLDVDTTPPSSSGTFTVRAGSSVRLRGLGLGTTAAGAQVLFNDTPIDTVSAWSTREVRFTVPWPLGGQSGTLGIRRNGQAVGNTLKVKVEAVENTARDWSLYE